MRTSSPLAILEMGIRQSALVQFSESNPIVSNGRTRPLPWIFDFRAILGQPQYLDAYAETFWDHHDELEAVQVCGVETSGIALVAAIVMKGHVRGKKVNGLYIRKSRKKTGLMKILEGTPTGDPIILVDDLINSGASIRHAIKVLSDAGFRVQKIFIILALRHADSYTFLHNTETSFSTLFTSDTFGIPLAQESNPVSENQFTMHWKFSGRAPNLRHVVPKSSPLVDQSHVYFASDDGYMRALDQTTGVTTWEYRVGRIPFRKGIFSTPALHGSLLYFGAYDGNVYALNRDTGKMEWTYRDADWVGSSPAIAPDLGLLFIGLEFGLWHRHGGIAALQLSDGKEVWTMRTMPEFTHCSPLYIKQEGVVVIGSNDGVVYCFSAREGKLKWTYATGGDIKVSLAYDASRRRIVFGSFDKKIHSVDVRSGKAAWTFDTGESVFSTPLVVDDTIFVSSLNKCIYALSARDGSKLWDCETNGRLFASPVLFNKSLWVGSNDGMLREIDPHTGRLVSYFQTSERITNPIAVNEATGFLFVSTQANELYCVSKNIS